MIPLINVNSTGYKIYYSSISAARRNIEEDKRPPKIDLLTLQNFLSQVGIIPEFVCLWIGSSPNNYWRAVYLTSEFMHSYTIVFKEIGEFVEFWTITSGTSLGISNFHRCKPQIAINKITEYLEEYNDSAD